MASAKPTIKDILASAMQAEKAGDTARAVAIYSNILAKFPKHSKAKKALRQLQKNTSSGGNRMTQVDANQLGQMLNQGMFDQVLERVQLLLVHNRKEPFLYNIQGIAQTNMGQSGAAITSFKHALKLNPNFVEAYNSLGLTFIQSDRPAEALAPLQTAINKRPDYPEAHHNLGVALAAMVRNEDALTAYNQAITLRPNYANAFNSRGAIFIALNDFESAIQDYIQAQSLMPDDPEVCQNLAAAYADSGNLEAALAQALTATKLAPENVNYLHSAASFQNDLGHYTKAIELLEKVLRIAPSHAPSLGLRVSIGERDATADHIARMEKLFASRATDTVDKVHLGFSLAKLYESAGDFSQSFALLTKANDYKFNLLGYDKDHENAQFGKLKQAYSPATIKAFSGAGNPDKTPILIVGLMRSGTSLVEQILASHSNVWGAGELMAATHHAEQLGIALSLPSPEQASEFAKAYLADLKMHAGNASRVTDKMPANFHYIGLMKLAFPNIKIINMVRDPRDNCYSIYKNYFDTQAHQYAYNQEHLANFANQYKSLMAHWHALFPGQIYDCKYEALTANQESETRKLLAYCDLEWEPQVLDFHKNKRAVRTASVNQVRQKIYQTSVRSWERVSDGLAPLIDGLDQELWSEYL